MTKVNLKLLHTESSEKLGGQEVPILMKMERSLGYEIGSVSAAPPEARIVDEARRRNLRVPPMEFSGGVRIKAMAPLFDLYSHEGIDVVNTHGSRDSRNTAPTSKLIDIPAIRAWHTGDTGLVEQPCR